MNIIMIIIILFNLMKYFFKYNKINNELYLAIKKSKNKNGTTFIISLSCIKLI